MSLSLLSSEGSVRFCPCLSSSCYTNRRWFTFDSPLQILLGRNIILFLKGVLCIPPSQPHSAAS